MLDSVLAASTLVAIWLAAFGIGQACLPWHRGKERLPLFERLLWPSGVGFLAGTIVIVVLGSIGLANKGVVTLGTLVAAAFGLLSLAQLLYEELLFRIQSPRPSRSHRSGIFARSDLFRPIARSVLGLSFGRGPGDIQRGIQIGISSFEKIRRWIAQPVGPGLSRGVRWAVNLGATGTAAASFLAALAPPTAEEAIAYHLSWVRSWQITCRLELIPWWAAKHGPGLADVLFFWGVQIGDLSQPGLLSWTFGLLLAGATAVFASFWLGRSWGGVAGAVVLLIPVVNSLMSTPSPEIIAAGWSILAVTAAAKGVFESRGMWYLVAILFAGGSALVLSSGLWVAVGVAAIQLYTVVCTVGKSGPLAPWKMAGLATVVVILISYGGFRNSLPGHPSRSLHVPSIDSKVREGRGTPGITAGQPSTNTGPSERTDSHLLNVPRWLATGWPFGEKEFQELGLLFPAVLPALLWYGIPKDLAWCAVGAGLYWLLAATIWPGSGFLLLLVPILTTFVVSVWRQRTSGSPQWDRLVDILILGILAGHFWGAVSRSAHFWPVALGWETREEYLSRHEPTWKAVELLSLWPRETVKLLTNETRRGYLPGSVLGEEEFFREIGNFTLEEDPEELIELLRSHQVSHLLIREIESDSALTAAPLLARIVDVCQNCGSDRLVLVSDYRFSLPSGSIIRYRLYFLPPIEKK